MGGGASEVVPLQKRGGGVKSFSHREGGRNKFWGSFKHTARGQKRYPPFKMGGGA